MTRPLMAALAAGVRALGLSLSEAQLCQLLDYLDLIQKWNKVYNLTALKDPKEMLVQHLLDSLAVVAPLNQQLQSRSRASTGLDQELRLLDVGSGAGLPGVVLAICHPEWVVHCVDAVAKKATFIQQAAIHLHLPKLKGVHARVEELAQDYDVVCSRAFASLADFTSWSKAALREQGMWMAMKGKQPGDEIAKLPADVAVFHVEPLHVPTLSAERCIVWIRKSR